MEIKSLLLIVKNANHASDHEIEVILDGYEIVPPVTLWKGGELIDRFETIDGAVLAAKHEIEKEGGQGK